MSQADYIITRLNGALKRIGGMSRPAYLRTITQTGGDSLLGRAGSTSYDDVAFSPQPVYVQLGHRQAMLLSTADLAFTADDYRFTFSPTIITKEQLQSQNVCLVLKDGGNVEVLRIIYVDDNGLGGESVAFSVFARSIAQ